MESNLTSKRVDDLIAPNANSEGEGNYSPGFHLLTEDIPETNQLNGADDENTSNLTRKEKVLLINAFVLKHGLTKGAVEDLMTLLQLLTPDDMDIPSSHFLLKKEIEIDQNHCKMHYLCPHCKTNVGEQPKEAKYFQCRNCESNVHFQNMQYRGSYFITFDIRHVITSLLKTEEISTCLYRNLLQRNANSSTLIKDICDGNAYKELQLDKFDMTLSLNTDGVSPFRSSKFSFWPVLISINEFDYGLRRQNTILIALWRGKEKPNFDAFFKPVVKLLNEISTNPIVWCYNEIQLEKQLETNDFKEDSYNGIKNASQLLLLKNFNIVSGFTYDVMHSSYLGVMKMLTAFWFDSCHHDIIFYIGRHTQQVDKKLFQCRVPYDYDRTIRSILHRKFWKATVWRTWMFVSTTILKGILPEVYRSHLLRLSNSLMLLSDEKITPEDLLYCEEHLSSFAQQTEVLYGLESCTFNLHILTHASTCVKNWGPLWSYSVFQYENFNGLLGNLFPGTKKINTQIEVRTLELISLRSSCQKDFRNEFALDFFKPSMQSKHFAKQFKKVCEDIVFIGPSKKYLFSSHDQRKLKDYGIYASYGYSFRKCIVKGKVYSRTDQITEKRNNSIIATFDNKLWLIQNLVYINFAGGSGVSVVQRIRGVPSLDNSYLTTVTNIENSWSIVLLSKISRQKFITLGTSEDRFKYLIRLPNTVELE
ncbi:unnamed protein product [Allacma fusca]|uniref:Uncharacterized protein n=1 Tax=Allacma fusca TaxID=39272 RepID=A0A8J2L9R9_9HEXA|nr:unnamed protein product [Allacma fusca]